MLEDKYSYIAANDVASEVSETLLGQTNANLRCQRLGQIQNESKCVPTFTQNFTKILLAVFQKQ